METTGRGKLDVRILYVEDEEDIRSATSLFLTRRIYELAVASNGEEGLQLFHTFKPDIVVTDIRMPKIDGLSMAQAIRLVDPKIPIIVVTAHSEKDYFVRAIDIGVDQFVVKPISTSKLFEAIQKAYEVIKTRKELEQSNLLLQEYRYALDQGAIVSKADIDGIITYVNPMFCEVSGYSPEELVGKPHNIVRHPDMPEDAFKELWHTILDKEIWRGQVKNRRKDGSAYYVQSVIIPILGEKGEIKEFISIRQDVTMQVYLEEALLKQEKKRIDELNQAKDSFLVVFSHELKTPLNAVINFSDYMAREIAKSDIASKDALVDIAKNVKSNGMEMLEIVKNILDLSRLKANKLEFNNIEFSLTKLVQEEVNKYCEISTGQKIDFELSLNVDVVIVSDMTRLRQIVTNFLSNAVKYGKGRIGVAVAKKEGRFVIVVEDNGEGIKNKEKIFDLFEQDESDDMVRKAKGTGIGLHFVKLLCENMNLQLMLDDSPKMGGARFRIGGVIAPPS